MAKNYFDQFDEPAAAGGSNFFDQFDGENSGKTDVRRVDNKIEADADAAPQEVVTSARAWNGAGAGRGKASDERRLDVGNESSRLDRERGIEKLMKTLRVDNAHAKESDVRALAEMLYDSADHSDGPAPTAAERKQAKIEALVKAGYQAENAQAKADFDQKFNERQAKKEAVDPLGRKAQISDSDGLQNTQQYMDEARAAALERIRKDRVQALSDESPILSALASGVGSTVVGLANAPQALVNAPIEAAERIGSALAGSSLNLPQLPKWSGTEKAMEFFAENMPSVANKSIEQSRRDGDMGMMLLTNLAANSPSNALSLIAMFAPPLRAALLPTMGAMAAGQSYATGDGAMASVLKGLVEVGTERLPLEGFDKTVTLLNKMPVPVRNNVLAVAGQKLLKAGAAITATSATNAIEEAAAQVGGNAIDIAVQGKPVGLMDDVDKSALIGAASGGALSAPHVAQIALQPGSVQSQIERAIADSLSGGEFAPIGPEAVHLANLNPNLAKATVSDIAVSRNVDEATAAFVSATSPSAPAAPLSEAITSDAPNSLAPNAGVRDTGGSDNAAAGVDIVGGGLSGDIAGGVDAGRVDTASELPAAVSGEPLTSTTPVTTATDASLLSRVPLDATEEHLGPNGDGYQTEKSAETKRVWAAKHQPELDWRIEPLDNGKFRVAGYPRGNVDGQQSNGRVPVAQAGGVSPQGDGVLRADSNAGGVSTLDQDVAARESFQRSLDDAHASDPSSPKVTLNPPAQAEAAQLERALEQTRALFGVRTNVRFFSDTDPNSVNGVHDKSTNTVWVNTAGLSYNALGTGFHETHHVMQAMAEADDAAGLANTPAQRYRDKVDDIFDSMSEAGKRSYIENFLYKDKLKTIPMSRREEAIQRMLVAPLTRREMMADFIGNRATDKAFIRSLAKADPVGFKEWAKKWLEILDNLLATLKGDGKNKESINVDKYVADLKQARKVVVEALVEFRQAGGQAPAQQDSAPAFQGRQRPGGGRRFVSVDEFEAYDPDTTGELGNFDVDRAYAEDMASSGATIVDNAEAANAPTPQAIAPSAQPAAPQETQELQPIPPDANPNDVTLEHMKQHGLFPERAFPFMGVREVRGGLAIAIDAHGAYPNVRINRAADDQYMIDTDTNDWFANGSKFRKDLAITLAKAHISRGMVVSKKFDIASAYRKSTIKKLVDGWKRIASIPGAFALNKTSSSTDLQQIARDLGAFKDHVLTVGSEAWGDIVLRLYDTADGKVYSSTIHGSGYGSDGFAINTMNMKGSKVGSDVYSVVAVYAQNTGQKFYCDGMISAVNTFRRTEQAFSYALKSGDSGVLLPGYQNRVYGHNWSPRTQDDHDMNIARLALANMRNVMEVLPDRTTRENGSHRVVYNERTKRFVDEDGKQTMIGLTRMTYDLTTGRFGDQSGRDITEAVLDWIKDPLNRGTGIGSSTLARAIITNQIIKGTLDIDSVLAIGKPVAYQKRQGILDATDAQPVENVAEKQYDYDAALESKWERISRFVNDHPRLVQQFEKDAANGKEEAAIMRLIAHTGFRIGGRGLSKGESTFGAANLMAEHVSVNGNTITFNFRGKSGVQQVHTFVDRALATDLKARLATGRDRLFTKADRAVRKYHDSVIGDADYKVHDYRTMVATNAARKVVDSLPQPQNEDELKAAIRLAAEEAGRKIGDDYATALKSYIHPDVFAGWRAGLQQGEPGVQESAGKGKGRVAQAGDNGADARASGSGVQGEVAYSRKQDNSESLLRVYGITESDLVDEEDPEFSYSAAEKRQLIALLQQAQTNPELDAALRTLGRGIVDSAIDYDFDPALLIREANRPPMDLSQVEDDDYQDDEDEYDYEYTPEEHAADSDAYFARGKKTTGLKLFLSNNQQVTPNGNPLLWYHGTAREFSVFNPRVADAIFVSPADVVAEDFAAQAADYLTPEEREAAVADSFEQIMRADMPRDKAEKLADQIEGKRKMSDAAERIYGDATDRASKAAPYILPLIARTTNVFDFANAAHVKALIDKLNSMKDIPASERAMLARKAATGHWVAVEEPPVQRAIRELGHDGFYAIEHGIRNLAVFKSAQLKSAIGNNGNYDIGNPDIGYSRKQDISPIGFYSALSRAVDSVNASAAPAAGWKDAIKGLINKGAVKADEVEWTGLNDWLDLQNGRVTKEQVQEFLKNNGVQVEEVQHGGTSPELRALRQRLSALQDEIIAAKEDFQNSGYLYREVHGYNLVNRLPEKWQYRYDKITRMQEEYDQLANDEYDSPAATPTKYGSYTLPGGENYREVLLTLPSKMSTRDEIAQSLYGKPFDDLSINESARVLNEISSPTDGSTYRSSHWDQPNVLAHIRLNDRTDADGKRVLFVEEIQSDWGQEGKKRGFATKSVRKVEGGWALFDGNEQVGPTMESKAAADEDLRDSQGGYVPTAPFVTKTEGWLNLALKRIITMAAEGGYDRVAFVNGAQSAERYDLSKQVDKISIGTVPPEYGKWQVVARKDGEVAIDRTVSDDAELAGLIGKELAEKAIASNGGSFSGLDLKVGGEGMKTFYDSIVPKATNELLRKLKTGAKLGEVAIDGASNGFDYYADGDTFVVVDGRDNFVTRFDSREGAAREADRLNAKERTTQPGFDVTDAMRERAAEGMPLFQRRQSGLPDERKLKKARRKLQDSFIQVKVLQDFLAGRGGVVGEAQDVYLAEERMHGRTQEFLRDFADKQIKPLTEKAVKYGIELDELALYAYAKHAEERNNQIDKINPALNGAGSGMDTATAESIIQLVELEGNKDKFEELHQMLMGITSTTRRVLLQEGLITQEEYDTWESQYDNYIPLRGFEHVDDDGVPRPGLGRGFTIKGKESMRAMGRKSRAGDLIENVIRDHERAVIRGERNQVAKVFLDLALSNPDPNLWEVAPVKLKRSIGATGLVRHKYVADTSGPDVFTLKVGGNEVHIRIKDPLLMRAMAAIHKAEISDFERHLANTVGVYTSLMRNTLTRYNPAFGFLNAFKDAGMGAFSTYSQLGAKGMAKYFAHYLPSVWSSAKVEVGYEGQATMDKWMREMRFAGGTTGGFQMRDVDEIKDDLRDLMLQAGAAPKGASERMRSMYAYKMAQKFLRVLEFFGAVSENAARAAAYRAARESGMSVAKASSVAKNLTTNFNRKGELGGTINSLYLFYNASVQGSATLLKLMTHPRAQALAAGITGLSMALAFMAANAGDDDDGEAFWDKIPDFEKERNLIIMLPPGMDVDGSNKIGKHGRYIKIPVQYGLNVFVVMGYQIADMLRHAEDPKRGASFAKAGISLMSSAMGSFNPFGGSIELKNKDSWALAVAPTIGDAAYQMLRGVNGFGKRVSPEQFSGDAKPSSESVFPSQAGGTAHSFARWLNANTGGNKARSGSIDISPGSIENAVALTTGGLGKFLYDVTLNIPTKLIAQSNGHDVEIMDKDIPFWKNFYAELDGDQSVRDYYERSSRARKELATRKGELKLGEKHEYTPEEKALAKMGELATAYTEQMSMLRKKELAVADNAKLSAGEKMVKRREINKQREKLVDGFNKQWVKEMGIYDTK